MDAIDEALTEAWARVAPRVRADRLEALRRAMRRTRPMLARPIRPWCLCLRASDTRLNVHAWVPKYLPEQHQPHEIAIFSDTIRQLCKPVTIPWPGWDLERAGHALGRQPTVLHRWIRHAVFRARHVAAPIMNKEGKPVPVVWSPTALDPNADLGRAPDPVWGSMWQHLWERVPDDLEFLVTRVPITARSRDGRHHHRGWHFLCPGLPRLAVSHPPPFSPGFAGETALRGGAKPGEVPRLCEAEGTPAHPHPPGEVPRLCEAEGALPLPSSTGLDLAQGESHEASSPIAHDSLLPASGGACGRRTDRLYIPLRPWTLLDALGLDDPLDLSLPFSHSPSPSAAERKPQHDSGLRTQDLGLKTQDPAVLQPVANRQSPVAFHPACKRCHRILGFSLANCNGWNAFVSRLSAGLLLGREVARPPGVYRRVYPYRKRRARPAPQRDRVLNLILRGVAPRDIAARLGITLTVVRKHEFRLYQIHAVHRRAELCAALGEPDRRPMPRRRAQVLRGLIAGLSVDQIAARMGISRGTVHAHCKDLYRQQGVHSRAALIARVRGARLRKAADSLLTGSAGAVA